MADWVGIKYATNSTLGTSNFSPIDEIIKSGNSSLASSLSTADNHVQSLRGGVQRFTADGTFTVPANITKVWITACAGGGKGTSGSQGGNGGDGGDWIYREPYAVTPGQTLNITVGIGSTSAGTAGGATVISPLVTLACPGKRGGRGGNKNTNFQGQSGLSSGGYGNITGEASGGGGSLGRGGDATNPYGSAGFLGGGSSGSIKGNAVQANGANGIVIIEW